MRVRVMTLLLMASLGAQAHPLDGQWWDVKAQRFSDEKSVQARATAARYVLLGEKHDSAIHHAEQLAMLQALASHGWRGALAMEQFDQINQAALTAAQQTGARDADTLADAGQLNRKGWRWPMYKDLIAFAAAQGWPLRAANLSRAEGRAIALGETTPALPPADAAQQTALEADVIQGHCGEAPEPARLAAIVLAQRARDARMAEALRAVGTPVVLIAGAGHVRTDRAVPRYLTPPDSALAVAYVETDAGKTTPAQYDLAGFDLVRFTPATVRPDPCAAPLTGSVSPSSAKEKP